MTKFINTIWGSVIGRFIVGALMLCNFIPAINLSFDMYELPLAQEYNQAKILASQFTSDLNHGKQSLLNELRASIIGNLEPIITIEPIQLTNIITYVSSDIEDTQSFPASNSVIYQNLSQAQIDSIKQDLKLTQNTYSLDKETLLNILVSLRADLSALQNVRPASVLPQYYNPSNNLQPQSAIDSDDLRSKTLTVTEGTTLAALTATTGTFSGNITALGTTFNGISYSWPSSQDPNKFLKTDGNGSLSWSTAGVSSNSLDFDEINSNLTLDSNLTIASNSYTFTITDATTTIGSTVFNTSGNVGINAGNTINTRFEVGGTASISGVTTLSDDVVFTANKVIRRNTSDGSDSGYIWFTGGGGGTETSAAGRGGAVYAMGNEDGNDPGGVKALLGNVSGSSFRIVKNATGGGAFSGQTTLFMVAESNGHIGIGAIADAGVSAKLHVKGDVNDNSQWIIHTENLAGNTQFAIRQNDVYAPAIENNTTATAANVTIDGTTLKRSTSSARYKTNIQPMTDWRWLLDVEPITFNDKKNPNGRTFGGLLAEEVAIKGPANAEGIPLFAGLDKEGRPDDVAYPHLVAPLILGLQDHESKIASLSFTLEQIQAQIDSNNTNVESIENNQSIFSFIIAEISNVFQITFQNGLIQTVKGIFQNIEVQNGVTIYDRLNGQPFCIGIENGQTVTTSGKCGEAAPTPESIPESTTESTPEITPEPTPTVEGGAPPDTTAESTIEPTPEITPEPTPES